VEYEQLVELIEDAWRERVPDGLRTAFDAR
jgi:hypothetical protein